MTATPKALPETPERRPQSLGRADVLSDVLRVIHLSGAIFFRADLAAPWAVRTASAAELARLMLPGAKQLLLFHIIAHGRCWIALDGAPPFELAGGDIVLMPYGGEHTLASDLSLAAVPMRQVLKPTAGLNSLVVGRGPHRTRVICGFLQCEELLCTASPRLPHMWVTTRKRPSSGPSNGRSENRPPPGEPVCSRRGARSYDRRRPPRIAHAP
jgi:hypothetical protein